MKIRKEKVGIVTIYDLFPNYGNRLQNYALQSVITKLGMEVFTYSFEPHPLGVIGIIKYLLQRISGFRLRGGDYWRNVPPQISAFHKFNRKYIKTKRIYRVPNQTDADFFVLGSDQVWNPEWYNKMKKEMFFLTFASAEKKVCFSPSFGVSSVPEEWKSYFQEQLDTFPKLSVREQTGARIIMELINCEATVLIDPTLMLGREEWRELARRPGKLDFSKPYILTYFLGDRTEQIDYDLEQYASMLHAQVFNLKDYGQPELYATDPCEFLYLIDHAKLVLTDSFHGAVFSFLFGKPFLVYKRLGTLDMTSRIDTLFEKFDLKRKYVDSGLMNELLECNYENGYRILEYEREKAHCYLKEALHLK